MVDGLVDRFKRVINPYHKVIDDKLQYLPGADRREIAAYLQSNEDLIKSYLGEQTLPKYYIILQGLHFLRELVYLHILYLNTLMA